MRFTLTNTTSQTLDIYLIDDYGGQFIKQLGGKKTDSFEAASLHPNTEALLQKKQILSGEAGLISTAVIGKRSKQLIPLTYAGFWQPGIHFGHGAVVESLSVLYVCTAYSGISSTSSPQTDQQNWMRFSFVDLSSVFSIDGSLLGVGDVFKRSSDGWSAGKIGDASIADESISISKVSGLSSSLGSTLSKSGGTMTGPISMPIAPTSQDHLVNKAYADLFLLKSGGVITGSLKVQVAPASRFDVVNKEHLDGIRETLVLKSGGVMTGPLSTPQPSLPAHAANKEYVDAFLPKSGGVMTGPLAVVDPSLPAHAATKSYVDSSALLKSGGAMVGPLSLIEPTLPQNAATKGYVDNGSVKKSGDTMTGHLSVPNPVIPAHVTNVAYLNQRLGQYIPESGGLLTGPLLLAFTPTEPLHACSKEYVDSTNFGKVPISGGEMTGSLTGNHGLLPLSGGALTGPLALADTQIGLAYSVVNETIMYNGKLLFGRVLIVQADYIVQPNDGSIICDASGGTSLIRFPESSAGFPPCKVVIAGKNFETGNVVVVKVGVSTYTLADAGEELTVVPRGTSWEVLSNSKKRQIRVFGSLSVESSDSIDITLKTAFIEPLTINVSAVSRPSPNRLAFTIGSSAPTWRVGDKFTVTGTSAYNGDYWVNSTDSTKLIAISSKAFVGTQAGKASGLKTVDNTSPVIIHTSVNTGESIESFATGYTLAAANNSVRMYGSAQTNNRQQVLLPGGTGVLRLTNVGVRTLYLHYAGVEHETGVITSLVQDTSRLSTSVVSIETDLGGGGILVTVSSIVGIKVGDQVTLSGTSLYDTTAVISAIGGLVISLPVPFTANSYSGILTNNNALTLSVASAAGFLADDVVDIERLEAIGPVRTAIEAVLPDSPAVVVRVPADLTKSKSGVIKRAPILKVRFT